MNDSLAPPTNFGRIRAALLSREWVLVDASNLAQVESHASELLIEAAQIDVESAVKLGTKIVEPLTRTSRTPQLVAVPAQVINDLTHAVDKLPIAYETDFAVYPFTDIRSALRAIYETGVAVPTPFRGRASAGQDLRSDSVVAQVASASSKIGEVPIERDEEARRHFASQYDGLTLSRMGSATVVSVETAEQVIQRLQTFLDELADLCAITKASIGAKPREITSPATRYFFYSSVDWSEGGNNRRLAAGFLDRVSAAVGELEEVLHPKKAETGRPLVAMDLRLVSLPELFHYTGHRGLRSLSLSLQRLSQELWKIKDRVGTSLAESTQLEGKVDFTDDATVQASTERCTRLSVERSAVKAFARPVGVSLDATGKSATR